MRRIRTIAGAFHIRCAVVYTNCVADFLFIHPNIG
jgi:hypothetical protein